MSRKFALLIHWTDKKSYLWNTVTLQKIFGVNMNTGTAKPEPSSLADTPFFINAPWRTSTILTGELDENEVSRALSKENYGGKLTMPVPGRYQECYRAHAAQNKTHLKSISGLHALAVKPMLGITKVDSLTPSTLNPQAAEFMSAMMPIFQAVDVLLSVLDASAQRNTVATNPQRVNLFELDETIELSPDQTRFKENEALQAYTAGFKSMFKNTHPKSRMLANVNQAAAGMRLVILFDMKAQNIIASEDDVAELAQILHPRRFIRAAEIAWFISPLFLLDGTINFCSNSRPSVSQLIGFWDALGNGRYSVAAYQESEIKMWTAILSVAMYAATAEQATRTYLTVFQELLFSTDDLAVFRFPNDGELGPTVGFEEEVESSWALPPSKPIKAPKRTGKKSSAPPSTGPVLRDRTVLAAKSAAPMVNISVASSPKKRKATSRKARATPDLEEEEEWCKHEPEIVDLVGDDARLQEQYEGKLKVDLDSERKRQRSEEGFTFKIYDAVRTPGQIPKEEEFTMFGFENSWEHNKRLMSEIVAAQRCGPDGLPLFLHDSAANPDPSLIPSQASVSLLHVTTPTEFAKLPKLLQQQIFRNRCLLFNDVRRDDLPKAFDEETLEQYRELDSLTEIQGVFHPLNHQGYLGWDLFSDLLRPVEKDGHQRTLNALSNVLPNKSMELPPAWSTVWLLWCFPRPDSKAPYTVVFVCTAGANSWQHIDTSSTCFEVLFGTKIVALAYRKRGLPETDLRGDWRSRHAFDGWDGAFSNTDYYEYEIFPLRPGQVLVMAPHIPHTIWSPEASIVKANILSARPPFSLQLLHAGARWIFLRIFRFQVRRICGGRSGSLHVPDLLTKEGCLDLLYLHHFIVLYLVFHPWSYLTEALENVESNMSDTHWTELCGTQALSVELEKYILANFQFQYTAPSNSAQRFRSFLDVLQYSLTHLAITLSIAKSELWDDENPGSFTPEEFDEQLTAALQQFDLLRKSGSSCADEFQAALVRIQEEETSLESWSHWMPCEQKKRKVADQERPSDADRVPKKKR
ncbi:hypothetical protein C8J57DRAFT_1248052 [Mycena rebaudengoi]|nr:hypothetical protein C8J57DRAFT_1248052 [Mycena rebaudengoi]